MHKLQMFIRVFAFSLAQLDKHQGLLLNLRMDDAKPIQQKTNHLP